MQSRLIPIDLIDPDPDQPRKRFDEEALYELADSIDELGLLQPITVRPHPRAEGRWMITAGERRYRAHMLLADTGRLDPPVVIANVVEMTELAAAFAAIVENLQRVDVTPLEEAAKFQQLIDLGVTVEELARKIGRRRSLIEDRLRLMNLEPTVLRLCQTGQFDHHVAQEIGKLDKHDQTAVVRLWNSGQISGFAALRGAVAAKAESLTQVDMFGDSAPKASTADIEILTGMESRINSMAYMASTGWKDGACVVAVKVSRDRARLMADKLKAMQSAIRIMENDLRVAAAQAEVVFETAA